MNKVSTAMVTMTLTTISANQPSPVCGGCQFQVASEATTKIADDDTSAYQVISRASAPSSAARVISPGLAPTISDNSPNATTAAAAPRQPSLSMPISAPRMPVNSG